MKSYSYILEHNAVAAIRRADAKFDNDKITFEQYEKEIRPWIDATPVEHGHWVAMNEDSRGYADEFACTNCSCVVKYGYFTKGCDYEWCPSCGARMDEVE